MVNPLPSHVAIIMDGNGRWAVERGLPRLEGHRRGVEVTEDIITAASDMGIRHLTLYAFSDENWDRPDEEVQTLMFLLREYLSTRRQKMINHHIVFKAIGDVDRLPEDVQHEIALTEEATRDQQGMTLHLALSYGARNELCRAFNRLAKKGKKEISPDDISAHLDCPETPDPDLLIRTSGERRISNFLLWQLAYSELYFTTVPWPEFNIQELERAIDDYRHRQRRFGKVS